MKNYQLRRALNTILVAVLFWLELAIVIVIVDTIFPYVDSWFDLIAKWTILIGNLIFAVWCCSKLEEKLNGPRMF